jgi:hypothetical protein
MYCDTRYNAFRRRTAKAKKEAASLRITTQFEIQISQQRPTHTPSSLLMHEEN